MTQEIYENTRLLAALQAVDRDLRVVTAENARLLRFLRVTYGLGVPCQKCGAAAMWPCITDNGKVTIHERRVTRAVAGIPANDLLTSGLADPAAPPSDKSASGRLDVLPAASRPEDCNG